MPQGMTLTHILLLPKAVKTLERANTESLRLYMGVLSPTYMCAAGPLWRGRGRTSLLCSTATQSPLSRKEVTLAHMPKPESEKLELHKHTV